MEVHKIVADLEVYPEEVHKRYIVAGRTHQRDSPSLGIRTDSLHVDVGCSTSHHKFDSNSEQAARFWLVNLSTIKVDPE